MEIKYTNFELDEKTFGKNEICALFNETGTFIEDNIYDVRTFNQISNLPVGIYLRFGTNVKTKKLIFDLLSEFEISKELQRRPLKKLSTSEFIKVQIIKLCASPVKNIILDGLDTYFNYKDLTVILKTLKNHLVQIDKTVIVTANKVDNLVQYADRYIIVEEGRIIYAGCDYEKAPLKTDIRTFTNIANDKGAKLKDYKEANDLLKAIYRSVKR